MSVGSGVIGVASAGARIPGRPRSVRPAPRRRLSEWFDRHSGRLFIMPAVIMILVFSIFPLIASAILALSRVRLAAGGYDIRFVGLANFEKQFFGSEQFHFLGTFDAISRWAGRSSASRPAPARLVADRATCAARVRIPGLIGRLITAALLVALASAVRRRRSFSGSRSARSA